MKPDLLNYFVQDGVYKMKSCEDYIFICMSSANTSIGKLVQYKYDEDKKLYVQTGNTYFLNTYMENDIKTLFLKRENYDMVGLLGQNFVLSDDELYILEG